ncbi:DUF3224 domain-containing protein [Streptomyces sp. NPDC004667]|uniref:DUF3224 domain-containing protein n=1 Tax=Streptomyces sp. NPDC004667 TaxID=3154285 RepID=UPI0033BA602E
MSTPTQTGGRFTFAGWEEQPVGPADTMPRLAHAMVTNSFTGAIEASDTSCSYAITYTGETSGTYAGMELLSGAVEGRAGTFVLEERGEFDSSGTRCRFEVVPGSGTGELTGISGSGGFDYRHGEQSVPYTFTYTLA